MRPAYFKHLTMRRKAALVFALVWWPVFAALFVPPALRIPPSDWAAFYTVFGGAYSAAAMAVVAVELIRFFSPHHMDIHNDAIHFRWVSGVAVLLVSLIAVAYLVAIAR